jgi:hypothetical protein
VAAAEETKERRFMADGEAEMELKVQALSYR